VPTFACPAYGRRAIGQARTLVPRVLSDPLIEALNARLRCTRCGARGQTQLVRIRIDAAQR
jgi:hypothetical protein